MPNLTKSEREETKALICLYRMRGYTQHQTLDAVNDNLKKTYHKQISITNMRSLFAASKADSRRWFDRLLTGRDEYIDEFRQIMLEYIRQKRDLWDTIEIKRMADELDSVYIGAHQGLIRINQSIVEMLRDLPFIMTKSGVMPNSSNDNATIKNDNSNASSDNSTTTTTNKIF